MVTRQLCLIDTLRAAKTPCLPHGTALKVLLYTGQPENARTTWQDASAVTVTCAVQHTLAGTLLLHAKQLSKTHIYHEVYATAPPQDDPHSTPGPLPAVLGWDLENVTPTIWGHRLAGRSSRSRASPPPLSSTGPLLHSQAPHLMLCPGRLGPVLNKNSAEENGFCDTPTGHQPEAGRRPRDHSDSSGGLRPAWLQAPAQARVAGHPPVTFLSPLLTGTATSPFTASPTGPCAGKGISAWACVWPHFSHLCQDAPSFGFRLLFPPFPVLSSVCQRN